MLAMTGMLVFSRPWGSALLLLFSVAEVLEQRQSHKSLHCACADVVLMTYRWQVLRQKQ